MRFADFLKMRGLNDGQAADLIGCDRTYVLKLRGGKKPSPDMMATIAEKTDGAVQPNDWFDLPDEAAA